MNYKLKKLYLCTQFMMLELHHVTIGQLVKDVSLTVGARQLMTISGASGSGKTTLLRAVLGFLPIDNGHISIDGELLTPLSAPYFRRQTAYVPQRLVVPDWYQDDLSTDYVRMLEQAAYSDKQLLIIDEPAIRLDASQLETVDRLLHQAAERGAAVLAVTANPTSNIEL